MKYLVFFMLCILQPICLPVPETTTILTGTMTLGSNEAFIIGLTGIMTGIILMYKVSFSLSKKFLRKFKQSSKYKTYKKYISHNPVLTTGILFTVPIIPDEIICIGSAIGEIPLKFILPIAAFSKIISIGMITYSEAIASKLSIKQWQVITIELIIMFILATIYQKVKNKKEKKN